MTRKDIHEYAWNWFEYHATQRLTTFRFFLVFFGFIIAAISSGAANNKSNFFLISVAIVGIFVCAIFFILEFRNDQLVNVGRAALMKIEKSEEFNEFGEEAKLLCADKGRFLVMRYTFLLKAIYTACMVVFVILAFSPSSLRGTS